MAVIKDRQTALQFYQTYSIDIYHQTDIFTHTLRQTALQFPTIFIE